MNDERFSERRGEYVEISGDTKGQWAKAVSHRHVPGRRRLPTDRRANLCGKVTNRKIWIRI